MPCLYNNYSNCPPPYKSKGEIINSFSSRLKSHHCLSNKILYTIPVNMNSSYAFCFYSLVWIVDNDVMALVAVVVLEIDLTDTS